MKVWIDSDLCMGAGTCEQISPDVFHDNGDGTWVVKEDARHFGQETVLDGFSDAGHGAQGAAARVPESLVEQVLDAAEQCPGECIYVEL